jgi:hypothetical protein
MTTIDSHITYSINTDLAIDEVTELLGIFADDCNVAMIVFAYNQDLARLRTTHHCFRIGGHPYHLRELFWHLTEVYDTTSDGYAAHMAELAESGH